MQAAGGGKGTSRFAGQFTVEPEVTGTVQEVLERCRHVTEAGRATQGETCALRQVGFGGIGGSRIRYRGQAGGGIRGNRRNRPDSGFYSCHSGNAAADLGGHLGGLSVAAVVEHQHIGSCFCHG